MATLKERIDEFIEARGLGDIFDDGMSIEEKYEAITGIVNPGPLCNENDESYDKEGWHVPGGFATSVEDLDDSSDADDGSDDPSTASVSTQG